MKDGFGLWGGIWSIQLGDYRFLREAHISGGALDSTPRIAEPAIIGEPATEGSSSGAP